jgi:hypothetical protein
MSEENINTIWLHQFYENDEMAEKVEHFKAWIAEYERNHLSIFGERLEFEDLSADMQVGVMWRYIEENRKCKRPMAYQLEVVKLIFIGLMKGFE